MVPGVTVAVAEKTTVTVHAGPQGLFVKVAVTPVGRPEAEKVIGVAALLTSDAEIDAEELVPPRTTVRLLGDGVERPKSKAVATTVTMKVVSCVTPPPET